MSDNATQQNEDFGGQEAPQWVKDLRKQVKDMSTELESLRPLRQENHLLRHNVDPTAPTTKLFLKGWDGDWSDQDAVAEAIKEYELPTVSANPEAGSEETPSPQQAQEVAAHQRIAGAASTGAPTAPPSTAPDYSKATTAAEVLEMYQAAGGLMVDSLE